MRKLTTQQLHQVDVSEIVGQSVPHESAAKQVAGEAVFVDDQNLPAGCLHAAVVTSQIAKGCVSEQQLDALHDNPDVVAVIRYDDIPGHQDIGPIFPGDPLLSEQEIRYHQQPIALVLCHSHQRAWQVAAQASQDVVQYQSQVEPILNAAQAKQASNPTPFVRPAHRMGKAVSQDTLKQSELVLSGEQHIGGQEHFYLEGQVSLAMPSEDGILLYTSSQHPSEVQKLIAEVLNIAFHRVTVDMRRMGGGFGGKETQAAQWACLASLAAWQTGKPVKIRLPRSVDMAVTGKRHPFYNRYQLGVSRDGVIESAKLEVNGLCGHSPDLSDAIVDRAMFHSDNAYSLSQAEVVGNRLKTDTVSHTAFRGFGGPQGMMLIEQAMQDIAIATGQDPLDVRYKNLYHAGNATTHYGMPVEQHQDMCNLLKQLEQNADYRKRRQQINQWNHSNPTIKKGLALSPVKFGISFTAKHLNQAGALINVYTDGSVQLNHGGTEMGQGLHTKVQQIVAQTLGIPFDYVLIKSTRTDKVPNTSPTAASSGSDLNGMAAHLAAADIKQRLLDFAQSHYQVSEEQIQFENGQVTLGENTISWGELVQQAYMHRVPLSATGFYKTPKIWYNREQAEGRPFYYFSLGAACSEVSIDTLTGEMSLDRVDILHDVGASLNPAIDIGQIEGAFIQGVGWLTTEELVWNEQGRLLSQSPANYKIPTIGDYPKQMNISLFDQMNPEHSIYRSKAVGEPPFMLAISAWCAIYDAVASISQHQLAPQLDAPATGERILMACQRQFDFLEAQDA
ncbi:xanthine dehydrogenase molybdopterin binding subunit [Agarivorans sp. Toyoura001]|uniref:xanthine dehydrogenase molybdopterin binding subunit n=1 Tax=Agarivorans sp. Toyoura001 TaxID=2283141 RepID=UPI0010F0D797|nr:xanthine dehydrogenase molybdopterin binding subunit [Agarivorans sp. Toyoura001]GDY28049.1 xanthine dehydrogenase molybdopterin binding subunit [Agarivorans sp. Toyoura001]